MKHEPFLFSLHCIHLFIYYVLFLFYSLGELLPSGSEEEVELRGCSIWAVELVLKRMKELLNTHELPTSSSSSLATPSTTTTTTSDSKRSELPTPQINAILIDFYLWDYAKEFKKDLASIPIHYTYSVFY